MSREPLTTIQHNSKLMLICIAIAFFVSCNSKPPKSKSALREGQADTTSYDDPDDSVTRAKSQYMKGGYRLERFFLEDSAFTVSLQVPNEMDKFYTWIESNDTQCNTFRKYRFAHFAYPSFRESGFYRGPSPDSAYSITLSHINNYDCQEPYDEAPIHYLLEMNRQKAAAEGTYFELLAMERAEINGMSTTIATLKTRLNDQKYPSTIMWCFFKVHSVDVEVKCECSGANCKKFVFVMNESLKTIQIERHK